MSQIEEAKGGWPPHDLAHLAPHAPIQVNPDNKQGTFHVMQQNQYRPVSLPVPAEFRTLLAKPSLYDRAELARWAANNNKLNPWDTIPRDIETFASAPLTAAMMSNAQAKVIKSEPIEAMTELDRPKEEERKSTEHTNSYDGSASQSPSTDEVHSTSSEPIDVEQMKIDESDDGDDMDHEADNDETIHVKTEVVEEPTQVKKPYATLEETQLLLNLSHPGFSEVIAEAAKIKKPEVLSSMEVRRFPPLMGFLHSGTSAFSNIEPKEGVKAPTSPENTAIVPMPTPTTSSTPTSASFCRPPGLGPVKLPPPTNGQVAPLVCPICGFSCPSKFHYNSHMNTHGDHQCTMCDYTSRTEGRLKKHMRESHTVEEQLKAGLEVDPSKTENNNTTTTSPKTSLAGLTEKEYNPSDNQNNALLMNLSTTMASILDSTASAIAAITSTAGDTPTTQTLSLDLSSTPALLNSLAKGSLGTSALDQIRAFTENTSLLPENGINLANALGAVSQAINGEAKSPEKQSNTETRRSSSGKVKILKCKQCGHNSLSKDEQWEHARTHIPSEKQLNCQHCNFVTEYKHHLEYHYRNHIGSKPFQCKKCAYTCVNKSMLNSHMKSHTNHYQFRCMDCTYATKYCHSLKLHLKKYNHRRVPEGIDMNDSDSPINPESLQSFTPNSVTSEGPGKVETPTILPTNFTFPPISSQSLNYASQLLLNKHSMEGLGPLLSLPALNGLQMPTPLPLKCPICEVQCSSQEEQMKHNVSHIMGSHVPTTLASLYSNLAHLPGLAGLAPTVQQPAAVAEEVNEEEEEEEQKMEIDEDRQDELEIDDDPTPTPQHTEEEMDETSESASSPTGSSKTISSCDDDSQKQKAFNLEKKMQLKSPSSQGSVCDKDDESCTDSAFSPSGPSCEPSPPTTVAMPTAPIAERPAMLLNTVAASLSPEQWTMLQQAALSLNFPNLAQTNGSNQLSAPSAFSFMCPHCKMSFRDAALYQVHMGYHGNAFQPFKCRHCEFTGRDSLEFNLHLLQASHK